MSLLAPGWCLSCRSVAELLTSCHLPSTQTQTLRSHGCEAVQRCSTNPKIHESHSNYLTALAKGFFFFLSVILVAFDRRLWVGAAKSAFFLMVIYAQITLESIISLWCTVTAHNSWGDLNHDTVAAHRKHNTSFQLQLLSCVGCF